MTENNQTEAEQKQRLLEQHQRNLNYLEEQAAKYGPDVPLALHNALITEREAIKKLEGELAALGVSLKPKSNWQVLIIDADVSWREIVANHIYQFGGTVIECNTIPEPDQDELIESSIVAVVGASGYTKIEAASQAWIEDVVRLGRKLPIILLSSWAERDVTIALRHAFREDTCDIMATTIFKDNFDQFWFSRIVHQILQRTI